MKSHQHTLRILGIALVTISLIGYFLQSFNIGSPDLDKLYVDHYVYRLLFFTALTGLSALIYTSRFAKLSLVSMVTSFVLLLLSNPWAFENQRFYSNPWTYGPFLLLMLVATAVDVYLLHAMFRTQISQLARKNTMGARLTMTTVTGLLLLVLNLCFVDQLNSVSDTEAFRLFNMFSGGIYVLVSVIVLAVVDIVYLLVLITAINTRPKTSNRPVKRVNGTKRR